MSTAAEYKTGGARGTNTAQLLLLLFHDAYVLLFLVHDSYHETCTD